MARHVFKTKGDKAFWEAHDAIFDSQPKLEDADLNTVADRLGLSWTDIKTAIDGNKYADELQASMALATAVQEAQGTPDGLKRPNLDKLAAAQGLDLAKFKEALDSGKHKAKVEADAKLGNDAGINGTPAFVINGYYLSGAQPITAFRSIIDKALSEVAVR